MKSALLAVVLFLLTSLHPSKSYAFPEMVRHGYTNCTACHVSPDGSDILTAYGRSTSQAVLSTWGTESEALPFYGIVPLPEAIEVESYVRAAQTVHDTPQIREGSAMFMQAELQAAVTYGIVTGVGELGFDPNYLNGVPGVAQKLFSREHYLLARPIDTVSIRGGKFQFDYGIHMPDHTIATRGGLGWDQGTETYNLEAGYQGDRYSGSLTAVFGRPDMKSLEIEKGVAATGAIALTDTNKLGLSYFHGGNDNGTRDVFGPYGILSLSKQLYLLTEWDWQKRHGQNAVINGPTGFVSYNRLGYEIFQGLHIYGMEQNSFTKLSDTTTYQYSYGPGALFYPRPHFELQAQFSRGWNPTLSQNEYFGFLLGSIYL